jgi:hypothetical protein
MLLELPKLQSIYFDDFATIGRLLAEYQFEDRGLSCAIPAAQSNPIAEIDLKTDVTKYFVSRVGFFDVRKAE